MGLKFGSKSGSGYTRSAFPMQKGTASHASALKKETDAEVAAQLLKEKNAEILKLQLAADKRFIEEQGSKVSTANVNKKVAEDKSNVVEPSEKTKRLRETVKGSDFKTEQLRKREEKALDIDAMTRKERRAARKKGELGYLGKGLFGGHFKRKRAGKKYEKQQKKEDRSREQLAKSEAWDKLTPDQKQAKQREKMAYLTAMFSDDAKTMHAISKGQFNVENKNTQQTEKPSNELNKYPSVQTLTGANNWLSGIQGSQFGGKARTLSNKITGAYQSTPGGEIGSDDLKKTKGQV